MKEAGVGNAGMLTIDDAGMYQLRYNDLLAPMVKAIQELKAARDKKEERITQLIERVSKLESIIASLGISIATKECKMIT